MFKKLMSKLKLKKKPGLWEKYMEVRVNATKLTMMHTAIFQGPVDVVDKVRTLMRINAYESLSEYARSDDKALMAYLKTAHYYAKTTMILAVSAIFMMIISLFNLAEYQTLVARGLAVGLFFCASVSDVLQIRDTRKQVETLSAERAYADMYKFFSSDEVIQGEAQEIVKELKPGMVDRITVIIDHAVIDERTVMFRLAIWIIDILIIIL